MRSLYLKLVLSFLAISVIGTALVAVFFSTQTSVAFGDFMFARNQNTFVARLTSYYQQYQSWEGVDEQVRVLQETETGPGEVVSRIAVIDESGRVVIAGLRYQVGQWVPLQRMPPALPIVVEGRVVGHIITDRRSWPEPNNAIGRDFLTRVNKVLLQATIGATVLALVLSVFVSRSLTRPLRELTKATRAVAAGDLTQQVPVRSQDELGELAEAFNQMNHDLARSQDLRHQMTADVAHDLRTPLSIILGHAEALSDGALPPLPETFEIIYDEAKHLTRLVEDLRTLSLADAHELSLRKEPVEAGYLLTRTAAAHGVAAQAQCISIETQIASSIPELDVDVDRMTQVLDNLLENALRHTPEGGAIFLAATYVSGRVRLVVEDTGSGVPESELASLFERFYRVDKSRQRNGGGSGLGLAISRSIVESHSGQIWAENRAEGGLRCIVELPAG